MNLVYDLRYATDRFPGIGAHAFALGRALLDHSGIDKIRFLWDPGAPNSRFDLHLIRGHRRAEWHEFSIPAFSPLRTCIATGRLLRRLTPDAFLSPFWLRPTGARVPCLLTLHDVIPLALPSGTPWSRRVAYRWFIRSAAHAEAVITSSQFSRSEILRLTPITAGRLHVVPLGVPVPEERMHRPASAPDGAYALCVGTNRPHKGLETLLAAWQMFGDHSPLELVAAGAAGFGGVSPAGTTSIPGVRALGLVPPEELEWLYRHATIVLCPARYEGFGLPLLEAAARGTPVIASDIPPLRETGDGVARFVPAADPRAWGEAVRELAADAAARERMRCAGLERARQFSYERCARGVWDVLQTVAGARA